MKALITIVFVLFTAYSFGQTQAEMNEEAYASYQKADKELNEVYKKILVDYKSDAVFINNLRESQRIWITFRDAELNMKYPKREVGYYGSIHPICRASYLEELTRERTEQLRKWLAGVEEEDACTGSVRLKK
ncbi:DUF1311 domain-containing protein [Pontibacter sp. Tf4]|uniref:lysozyme inhibitor LprI family protein n=1 Tax=Pontibacter sp. Tf4 TaxID=2761620 RepID=UPI00162AD083|nr:lysozyme inhibitor LprI family protein [Pontibacter sp. Tf4]MBB6609432.1 DUF1311 domain-containing protein [Pontibacter sp. Tf4]